jgi:hypothetical protein
MWVCNRPIDDVYGPVLPDHKYVCCAGPNQDCYGHKRNIYLPGDPIDKEPNPNGQCEKRDVSDENKKAHCEAPKSPCKAGTFTWNCRDWAEWDGVSSCPIWARPDLKKND